MIERDHQSPPNTLLAGSFYDHHPGLMDHIQDTSRGEPAGFQNDLAWLARLRAHIESPSQRNPNILWHDNAADQIIEQQMQNDGHRIWGFVIYRSVYNNQPDWTEFLRRLRFQMEDMFEYYNGRDILDKFSLTILENYSLFNDASADVIRRHFQQ